MDSISGYLAMGGYSGYVWPAYALAAAVIAGLLIVSRSGLKSRERELKALQGVSPGRRGRSHGGSKTRG